ncbi:RING finger protein 213 [Myotis brandtii]|uniref:RING finger protein 213 n=1 Tax=Myotis brandtii TaxID=109478 RepID=S7MKE5_MYOBR|nr:RING finger protein 213 [Myotis brandtii]
MTNGSSVVSPQTQALDCDSLLRSCIQSAVGLLQDPSERSQRNVRRVEILLGLLSEDADNACKDRDPPSPPCCRHALWKRIQGVVTPLLASMVSVIDRDSNLELLAKPDAPAWTQELWMFIFNDVNLLNIPLMTKDAR